MTEENLRLKEIVLGIVNHREDCELEAPFNERGPKYVNKTCKEKLFCFRAVPLFATVHPFYTSGDSPPKTRDT